MSALQIPQQQAEQQLTRRIEIGQDLMRYVRNPLADSARGAYQFPVSREDLAETWHQAMLWHAFNQTWIDTNLGGQASEEYRAHQSYDYRNAEIDQSVKYEMLHRQLPREVSFLESIRERLPLWDRHQETPAAAENTARVSPDTPILIVHGDDTWRAGSVAHTVTSATRCESIIIRDKPNLGRTRIEKLEGHAAEVSYAIIVLTADDKGGPANQAITRPRGRQDVIFEMGYFCGLLGRDRVCVLLVPGVEKPSDMEGLGYITLDDEGAWRTTLLRELKHAGFEVSL